MATKTFGATVAGFRDQTEQWRLDVFRQSAQDAGAQMQMVGPSVYNPGGGEGGRMPVGKTGFLRASAQVHLNEEPTGFLPAPKGDAKLTYNPGPVNLGIAGAKITDRIYLTLGAEYGRYVDYRYGFVGFAADQWQRIVSENARAAKPGAKQ